MVSYLARGNVAFSVTITSVSTSLTPVGIPVLTAGLAGQFMPVAAVSASVAIVGR